ncbi:DUF2793 domain-containing protein [Sphingobium sp. MI1205]|uniref:DUF2793 domain-containing protein n=1 Tax=Sphingobium sp. MI1205 TaxID=407020 RepID=UPI000770514E|nr:DUF2793 domain-containing protein [Sphingobium sp. MI1205]AMK18691.1 hypothetical protein K663_11560 [Sphingobium sp. MI1205]
MTDFPNTGAPMWAASQASPWDAVNEASFIFDAFASRSIVEDRDLTAPPGSCANGARYLIAAAATGLWVGHDGELAIAIGTDASNGWYFANVARHGNQLLVKDEDLLIEYDGASWNPFWPGAAAALKTVPGTTYDAVRDDAGSYILFTNALPVAFTIPPEASVNWPVWSVLTFEQNGAGAVTVSPGSGVTINSHGSLYTSGGQHAVCQLKKVGTDIWTMTGDLT